MTNSTDEAVPQPEDNKKPKGLDLGNLLPPKEAVDTSIGILYVGGQGYSAEAYRAEADETVGQEVLRHLCNRFADKSERSPLSPEDAAALVAADIAKLGPVIAKLQRWHEENPPTDLLSLGQAARRAFEHSSEQAQHQMKKLYESMQSNFSFLTESTLSKLQGDLGAVAQMVNFSDLLPSSGVGRFMEELRKQQATLEPLGSILDHVNKAQAFTDELHKSSSSASNLGARIRPPELTIIRPEDSALGRASLKNAENSELAVKLMTEMTQRIGALQETMVARVLPEWFADVRRRQEEAKASSDAALVESARAATNLGWTVFGIAASIVVTVAATIWQVYVAKDIDVGNTEQIKGLQKTLNDQKLFMEEQQGLQKQTLDQQRLQLEELKALREQLNEQRLSAGSAKKPRLDVASQDK
ncbi:hypothetical protein [Ideonella sp.]|jgi:hypothetical protein|uniref:hypothetical protein n=1 Tax=Ideonella sp. TaxID=1929293 RepID=UPI0037BF0DA2